MENIKNLLIELKEIETQRYNRCSHPNSDQIICLNLSYQLWQIKVKIENIKKIDLKNY